MKIATSDKRLCGMLLKAGHPCVEGIYIDVQYDSNQDAVIMTDMEGKQLVIECKRANAQVIFDDLLDISYLHRLARKEPTSYVAFALRPDGLQGYVEAMNVFN